MYKIVIKYIGIKHDVLWRIDKKEIIANLYFIFDLCKLFIV